MKQFWSGLQPREQYAVMLAAVVVVLFLIYSLMIEPYFSSMQQLKRSVETQQKDLAWMKRAAAEVKALRGGQPGRAAVSEQSLLSLVDGTARQAGLHKAIKQLTPSGEKVIVRLQEAKFDAILLWLDKLESRHSVMVDSLTLERLADPGKVNATVVLGK